MASAYAWYYNAGGGLYYWAWSRDYSTSEFASVVSSESGQTVSASDVSYASNQHDLDKMKARASRLIQL